MEPKELNLAEVLLELNGDGKAVLAVFCTQNALLLFQRP